MKFGTLKFSLLIGGSLMAMMSPGAAFAAEGAAAAEAPAQPADEPTGNEIIVTATRQSQRL